MDGRKEQIKVGSIRCNVDGWTCTKEVVHGSITVWMY